LSQSPERFAVWQSGGRRQHDQEAAEQPENSNAQIEPYAPSPAIAIAEDVFGRELEEEVAALNTTQDEAAAQDSSPGEARRFWP
jgi:hypothetical protein